VTDTVVTTKVDGMPHRVLRTELVDRLERSGKVTSLPLAIRNAFGFRRLSGLSWKAMVSEGLAMKRHNDMNWAQVLMAANTPMLLKAALVDGHVESGVMASGQVVGVIDDLPTVADVIARIMNEAEATLQRLGMTS
jgi:NAD(P)H-dependent flavin oxidoreductase YrpB (nitropropane dioxygenase family)